MTKKTKREQRNQKDAEMVNVIAAVATIFFGISVGVFFVFICALLRDITGNTPIVHSKDLLVPVIASFGVLLAVLAFMRDWNKMKIDRMEADAKLLYEQSKEGLEGAFKLLENKPQDRSTWVYAAQLISDAQNLGQSIDEHSHYLTAYQIAKESLRIKLRAALSNNGQALPPAFFFGYENWTNPNLDLDDLKQQTQVGPEIYAYNAKDNCVVADMIYQNLDEQSVITIMEFLLGKQPTTENLEVFKQWPKTTDIAQGARKYLDKKQSN